MQLRCCIRNYMLNRHHIHHRVHQHHINNDAVARKQIRIFQNTRTHTDTHTLCLVSITMCAKRGRKSARTHTHTHTLHARRTKESLFHEEAGHGELHEAQVQELLARGSLDRRQVGGLQGKDLRNVGRSEVAM